MKLHASAPEMLHKVSRRTEGDVDKMTTQRLTCRWEHDPRTGRLSCIWMLQPKEQ